MDRIFRVRRVLALGATLAVALPGCIGPSARAATPGEAAPPVSYDAGFAGLVEKVRPAVVNIATTEKPEKPELPQMPDFPPGSPFAEMFRQFLDDLQRQSQAPRHALGSGFIIDADGTIVTNNHVIEGATKVMVTLDDGAIYPAAIKGYDERTDLAVLKIDAAAPLPHIEFGDSDRSKVGDWVIVVGNPFGLGGTVTAGILSARGRNLNAGPYDDFFQIDAPINPGNSGGPLFNQHGQVIGITSAIYTPSGGSVGIGFAIPSNLANPVIAQLREHGEVERGWLGVEMQPLTGPLARALGRTDTNGALVIALQPDSPANKAGIEQGDLVTAYNGKPIKDSREIALAVANAPIGTKVTISLVRNGQQEQTVSVTIAKQPATAHALPTQPSTAIVSGLTLESLSPDIRKQLNLGESVAGVVVTQVESNSAGAESGMHPGDIIAKIGNDPVATPADAVRQFRAAQRAKQAAIVVLAIRQGTPFYLALALTGG